MGFSFNSACLALVLPCAGQKVAHLRYGGEKTPVQWHRLMEISLAEIYGRGEQSAFQQRELREEKLFKALVSLAL
jgi:hypothetical protein